MTNDGSWSTRAGYVAGGAMAPITLAGSKIRGRLFHPRGIVLRGRATVARRAGPLAVAGKRLEGNVLVRFSGAWWKSRQWPDVLGCAIRFTSAEEPTHEPLPGDQDLLLATIRHPLTTLLAPATTDVTDYLANDYFGVSPFFVEPLGRVKLRLRPHREPANAARREHKLVEVLHRGPIEMTLQVRPQRLGSPYGALAVLTLAEPWPLAEEGLRFDPFRAGRGLDPVGFVHNSRRLAYAASWSARRA